MNDFNNTLHTKYRPSKLRDVLGQGHFLSLLDDAIENRDSQAYLLVGPSGTGKTTIARIIAARMGCESMNILEIDGATYTGIDAMREIQNALRYTPLGGGFRTVIVDECHRASRQAWDSLLKIVEEPPKHAIWVFCTTEPGKIPPTLKTRCMTFTLRSLEDKELEKIIDRICEAEKIELADGVGDIVIKEARGSARQAIVNLSICRDVPGRREAAEALSSARETDAVIDLCRFLIATPRGSWKSAMSIVKKLEKENPESVRIIVSNYMAKAIIEANSDKSAVFFLHILDAFATPYNASENMAPLMLSIGKAMYSSD